MSLVLENIDSTINEDIDDQNDDAYNNQNYASDDNLDEINQSDIINEECDSTEIEANESVEDNNEVIEDNQSAEDNEVAEDNQSAEDNENEYEDNAEENNEYIIDNDVDIDPEEIMNGSSQIDNDHNANETNNQTNPAEEPPSKKKRGLPKAMLVNQQKYLEALEKQQRMINASKKNKQGDKKNKKNAPTLSDPPKKVSASAIPPGTRRVIIAGKVKYLPINSGTNDTTQLNDVTQSNETTNTVPKSDVRKAPMKQTVKPSVKPPTAKTTSINKPPVTQPIVKLLLKSPEQVNNVEQSDISKIPPSIAAVKIINEMKQSANKNKQATPTPARRIPAQYAKQIENDVKKQTVKNVKNFSDLRRIKALEDIAPDANIDANRASIIELRKLRIEQRKKDQLEQRKRSESNRKESAIQEILSNDKMTKFSKAIAIKNLSVNSRTRKNCTNSNQQQAV